MDSLFLHGWSFFFLVLNVRFMTICQTYQMFHLFSFLLLLSQYQADEQVTLWVNKVGPYNNPQETYNYYSLPFCRKTENSIHKWGGLGEVLGGNELIDSQIDIKFLSMLFLMVVFSSVLLSWLRKIDIPIFCFTSRKCWQKRYLSVGTRWS